MKGVELPINVLVIVAIAVVVLLGLIGLFFAGFLGPSQNLQLTTAKNSACSILIQSGCSSVTAINIPVNFDADRNGTTAFDNKTTGANPGDNLQVLCTNFFNAPTDALCKKNVCNCP